jgi:GNAT superfamily N-acetyltransferase
MEAGPQQKAGEEVRRLATSELDREEMRIIREQLAALAPAATDSAQAVHIRPADPNEGERLREIAIVAKGHWGYDPERVRSWADQGDFSPAGVRAKTIFVAEADGRAVGWASLIPKGDVAWLDDLWIEPEWMGGGIGSRLFRHAAEHGAALGADRMEWEAEPNALGFYERMGGRYLRDSEPTEWGRVIPVMGVDLSDEKAPA